ncbi:hypothetical protein IFM12276_40760 [Nocardia sputorum]|uniref:Uncharacterized protein n=1 Tax=Nocardia sputorum TaxID=2984338 RepID=A0ABM8D134_9NOCA|nr:hypothetical protein IFM12276_40760 [Nocardia sputorum]
MIFCNRRPSSGVTARTNTSGLRATDTTSTGSITGHAPTINPTPGYRGNLLRRGTSSVLQTVAEVGPIAADVTVTPITKAEAKERSRRTLQIVRRESSEGTDPA